MPSAPSSWDSDAKYSSVEGLRPKPWEPGSTDSGIVVIDRITRIQLILP